ncbi:MAG: hypothetical protein QOF49_310 [Chloroflexota bacterium]|nr:hypothetical protein [Chloroflexota bacterium]
MELRTTVPVTAHTFPANDAVLAEWVREILRDAAGQTADEAVETVTRRVRAVHPGVSVSVRTPMAGFGDAPSLYVFRDGTALSKHREDWIDEPDVARLVTDASGRYVSANEAAADLFGVDVDDIIGRLAGSFTRPDVRISDADALWEALAATGRLHSLTNVQRLDGSDVPIEFVTIKDGDGIGRNVTVMRAVR